MFDIKVSVIVPIYNMEKYLERSINTLLEQTYQNYELILVDDGSNDGSGSICELYAQSNPKLVKVVHKENGGLSSARNAGIANATGKYIIFPDPDDWVDATYIEQLVKIQKEYHCDLAVTGYFIEFEEGNTRTNINQGFKEMNSEDAVRELFISQGMCGFAWNKLYSLEIIRKNRLKFLDDVGTTEDLDFVYRYLKYCKKICYASEIKTYHYYQRVGAATDKQFSYKKLESVRTYEKIVVDTSNNEIRAIAKEEICNTAINLLWMYYNSNIKDSQSLEKLRKYLQQNFWQYMESKRYGIGRKVQAILARFSPKIFYFIKNKVTNA